MANFVELSGGTIIPSSALAGGVLEQNAALDGGAIQIAGGGGGGGATLETLNVSYTPSETAISDTQTPSSGYDGFDEVNVTVGAIPSNYVGTGITRRTSSDLSASGATVTAPSGYYASSASKTIPNASELILSVPTVANDGTLSLDLDIVTGGYIASQSTTVTAYDKLTVQSAQTIYPSTSDQTIASGKYLTGAQTIKGVTTTNLSAGNIKKDVVVEVGDSADPDRILSITGTYEGGGGLPTAEPKDVNFIDYDGTIRYSYTNAEIALLSELPPAPVHSGLTSSTQAWNWTLADIKTQMEKIPRQPLFVGAQYNTSSGYTEIDVSLTSDYISGFYIGLGVNGTVTIDWGDGSATDTLTGTSTSTQVRKGHNYSNPGDYTIKLSRSGTDFSLYGTANYTLVNYATNNAYYNIPMAQCVRAVRSSSTNYFWIGSYAFNNLSSLEYITTSGAGISDHCFQNSGIKSFTIRSGRTSLTTQPFNGTRLRNVSIPKSVVTFSAQGFFGCLVNSICIPYGATSIGANCFNGANALHTVWVPETVTSIDGTAFNDCRAVRRYHFMRTTPPTLTSGSGFSNMQSSCQFYVPYSEDHSVLNAYKTASNWSNFASRMVEESV